MYTEPGRTGTEPDATPASTFSRRELLALRLPASPSAATPGAPLNDSKPAPNESSDFWIRIHRTAMACRFEVALSGEDGHYTDAARAALDEIDRLEAALTVFRGTSEISRINREADGGPVLVDSEVFGLLALCAEMHRESDGAFDITSTPLSRVWGFLQREGRLPAAPDVDAARARVGMDGVVLDPAARTVRFTRPGLELNLGGIGKGFALGAIRDLLRARGVRHALLSAAGSSVVALGGRGPGFVVDVHSRQAQRSRLARLHLRDCALATSGAGEQFVDVNGRRYGHVLDPRTGWPTAGLLSVTVVTTDPARADALSTAFLVGGAALASRYCGRHPETLALVTPDDGRDRPHVFGSHPGATLEEA